jgi:hypothetical protein
MAYCRNCGAEVSNEAYVCTKCGSLINPEKKKSVSNNNSQIAFHKSASFWLLFVAGIFFVISVMLFNMSLSYLDVYVGSYWSYAFPEPTFSILSFLASCVVLVLCVISYATSFKLLKEETISKSTNYFLLFVMISSVLYAFGKFFIVFY